ncbi:GtrA family protein [Candidatus Kaiserbacteria bacterium]|nr:GtrA family protein [Candidatus Kaiserbacteria bacterium]
MDIMHILKFLSTGIIGLSVNLGVFHTLYVSGVPYLAGSIIGFAIALFVGFTLQKFWTFEEPTLERARTQFMLYGTLAVCNLAVNTLIVYALVEYANAHYLIAQTIGAGSVALVSYFVYKLYIFRIRPI